MRRTARVFRSGEICILDLRGNVERFRSTIRKENCDAVICVYDETGNVIETHEHAGEFREP